MLDFQRFSVRSKFPLLKASPSMKCLTQNSNVRNMSVFLVDDALCYIQHSRGKFDPGGVSASAVLN